MFSHNPTGCQKHIIFIKYNFYGKISSKTANKYAIANTRLIPGRQLDFKP